MFLEASLQLSELIMGAESLFPLIRRFKLYIAIFWLIAAAVSTYFAISILNVTQFIILPPKGYSSYVAYHKMESYFDALLFKVWCQARCLDLAVYCACVFEKGH